MRILVTGGAGFIGSHLCDALIARGDEVLCVDNFLTGAPENIAHLQSHPRFRFLRHDVTQALDETVDAIFHLASPASPIGYRTYSIETLLVNSVGTMNMLRLATERGARFLFTSTSEVYGDPLVHPQTEEYWGNVNPIGLRACYDESKRFGEAATMEWIRKFDVDARLVRIFNSVMADERVFLFNDEHLHLCPVEEYVQEVARAGDIEKRQIQVPAFDPATGEIGLRPVSAVIRHPCVTDGYTVSLRYGRRLRVTGDHSVFRRGADGRAEPIPVRRLQPGDHVAIPSRLPAVEHDLQEIDLARELVSHLPEEEWWHYHVVSPSIPALIDQHRGALRAIIAASGRRSTRSGPNHALWMSKRRQSLPLFVFAKSGLPMPEDAHVRSQASNRLVPNRIRISDDLLWLLGLFLAEGTAHRAKNNTFLLSWCSDQQFLNRAREIIRLTFGIECGVVAHSPGRGPAIHTQIRPLFFLFDQVFDLAHRGVDKRVPEWVLQLPLSRLKWFLEGYKDGDGTHSGKSVGRELCFNCCGRRLADDLDLLLLRFGLVTAHGVYETTCKQRYGDRRFLFHRLTLRGLSDYNILNWDQGVTQRLQSRRWGDLVWVKVRAVDPCVISSHVYDFSVPGYENFVAGNGVCAHNTYGPKNAADDGRVVPNFINQAIVGEPITVYGDGSQTRSFAYVSDLVAGLQKALFTEGTKGEVFNLGNPREFTILEFAKLVIAISGSASPIVYQPLLFEDDPTRRRPDIRKARERLGWEPVVPLEDGLRETIAWYRSRLQDGRSTEGSRAG
jgi:UDP-glucuronate decarboxylase